MSHYRFKVFDKRPDEPWLQFYDTKDNLIDKRPLTAMDQFITTVENNYRTDQLTLFELGQELFHWLDGPTERWLAQAYQDDPELTLYIDVEGRLRHLPWELLYDNGFLCTHAQFPLSLVHRVTDHRHGVVEPANRPLRLLFMATSPQDVQPVLEYEQEEAMILAATQRQSIELVVEESGSLRGLKEQVEDFGTGYFDVFHLTGHADVQNAQPIFILENEQGFAYQAHVEDIAQIFRGGRWPRLVFLSGCKTGQAIDQGHLPSFCEALVKNGAPAVLGWALPVGDHAASQAAKTLYAELAKGTRLDHAVAYARQHLFKKQSPYWHLLRLYSNATPLTAHVTPLKTQGRVKLLTRAAHAEFLDAGAQVGVCSRRDFVGRRRVIQRCLRVLKSQQGEEDYAEGVLLHGMGGLGKSSLAGRLCERLQDYRRLVWVGKVNEDIFISQLNDRLLSETATKLLETRTLPLKKRLVLLLSKGELANRPALFIFDDFEHSLEADHQRIQPEALNVLQALLTAIHDTASESRVIVTCRYQFSLAKPVHLHPEGLECFRAADLDKKLKQLDNFNSVSAELKARAIDLADGNPRLLHLLNSVLSGVTDTSKSVNDLLDRLLQTQAEFRETLLLDSLISQLAEQDPAIYRFLALLSLYQLPVSEAAVGAMVEDKNLHLLPQAVRLSLVEAGINPYTHTPQYYTSALLTLLVEGELSESEKVVAYQRGAKFLYQTEWVEKALRNIDYALEIHRLAVLGQLKEIAVGVLYSVGWYWVKTSRYREVELLCQDTLSLGNDHRLLHLSAYVKHMLGDTQTALREYEEALIYCPKDKNKKDYAYILQTLADPLDRQGDTPRALEVLQRSLEIFKDIDDMRGQAVTMSKRADIIAHQGDIDGALKLLKDSLVLYEQSGDIQDWVGAARNISDIIAKRGSILHALRLLQGVLVRTEQIRDMQGQAATRYSIANILFQQGKLSEALESFQNARRIFEQIGDMDNLAATIHSIANIHIQQGNICEASELLRNSRGFFEKTGNMHGLASTMCSIAEIIAQQGDIHHARLLWQEILELFEKIGDVKGQAIVLQRFAWTAVQQEKDYSKAKTLGFKSLHLLISIQAWPEVVDLLISLEYLGIEEMTPFLLKGLWLATQIDTPTKKLFRLIFQLLEKLGLQSDIAPLAIAYLFHLSSQQEKLQADVQQLLANCAKVRGIEHIESWIQQERLTDPNYFLPTLRAKLAALVKEEDWVFDRSNFEGNMSESFSKS